MGLKLKISIIDESTSYFLDLWINHVICKMSAFLIMSIKLRKLQDYLFLTCRHLLGFFRIYLAPAAHGGGSTVCP